MIHSKYSKPITILYTQVDKTGFLGLEKALDIVQDNTTEFFESIGSDNLRLRKSDNAAWIITKQIIRFESFPFWHHNATVISSVSEKNFLTLNVDTNLFDNSGNLYFCAKQEFCAIDFERRKPLRIDQITFPEHIEMFDSLIAERFMKFKIDFSDEDFVETVTVNYCDIDYSQHTNNSKYVCWIINTLNDEFFEIYKIKEFEIQYFNESLRGHVLKIFKKNVDNKFYFLITNNDIPTVKAVLTY